MDLTAKLRDATGDDKAGLYFQQRISLCLIRGNAASIMGTLLKDDGYQLQDIALFINGWYDWYLIVNFLFE